MAVVALRGRAVACAAVAAAALTACGSADTPVAEPAALPSAVASVAVGASGLTPFVDPACTRTPGDRARDLAALDKAATQLRRLGSREHPASFSGLVSCRRAQRITVFRVPGEAAGLRRDMRKMARKFEVGLDFADGLFSNKAAQATRKAVLSRFDDLNSAGAPFAVLAIQENGAVEVRVRGDVAAAERVLAPLLTRIYVVQIETS
ncbi:MAG: hypothetical protein ACT4P1_12365 [Sporichthyaceae bacterium]